MVDQLSGSWGMDEHTLGLISIELQPIAGHSVIGVHVTVTDPL